MSTALDNTLAVDPEFSTACECCGDHPIAGWLTTYVPTGLVRKICSECREYLISQGVKEQEKLEEIDEKAANDK